MKKAARLNIKSGGNRTSAGHKQDIARGHQRPLRRHACECRSAMRLFDVLRTRSVIHPEDHAGGGIQRAYKRAHERPDARGKINLSFSNHGAASRGPCRDHAAVAEDLASRRPTAVLPHQGTVPGSDAVKASVIAGEIDFSLPGRWRESD